MMNDESSALWQMSASTLRAMLQSRKVSAVEVATEILERVDTLDGLLRAFITVDPGVTFAQAHDAQGRLDKGDTGPLLGIPFSLKDAFDTVDLRTTYGAACFASRRATDDAFVVRRLREAGGVLIGKTNMLEFCWGPTEAYPFGKALNPWSLRHSPGGSSSGAGVAVAAGLGPIAIGTDTGGSVRNPASFCGVVGFKPTLGRIGRTGMFPLSDTLDHVGVLTRRVRDADLVVSLLSGYDPGDPGSSPCGEAVVQAGDSVLLLPEAYFWDNLEPDVATRCTEAVATLQAIGFGVRGVHIPFAAEARIAAERILSFEAAAKHSTGLAALPWGVSDRFRRRVEQGATIDVKDYEAAMHLRQQFSVALKDVLSGGVLVVPSFPYAPYPLTDSMATGLGEVTRTVGQCTLPFNLSGTPAVTVPCGFTRDGLPVGLQFVASWCAEKQLLAVAGAFEAATELWRRWPSPDPSRAPAEVHDLR